MDTVVSPSLLASSFRCAFPACQALAAQAWYETQAQWVDLKPHIQELAKANSDSEDAFVQFASALMYTESKIAIGTQSSGRAFSANGLRLSRCYACKGVGVWVGAQLVWPRYEGSHKPHSALEGDVLSDFMEANEIASRSPRGAAALLRVAVERLCRQITKSDATLDEMIGELVRRGLDEEIQQALDVVRISGNDAVHARELVDSDNTVTTEQLFWLVNQIAEEMIARPARIKDLFGKMPETKRKQIQRRDSAT